MLASWQFPFTNSAVSKDVSLKPTRHQALKEYKRHQSWASWKKQIQKIRNNGFNFIWPTFLNTCYMQCMRVYIYILNIYLYYIYYTNYAYYIYIHNHTYYICWVLPSPTLVHSGVEIVKVKNLQLP